MVRVGGILDDEVSRSAQAALLINVLEVPEGTLQLEVHHYPGTQVSFRNAPYRVKTLL